MFIRTVTPARPTERSRRLQASAAEKAKLCIDAIFYSKSFEHSFGPSLEDCKYIQTCENTSCYSYGIKLTQWGDFYSILLASKATLGEKELPPYHLLLLRDVMNMHVCRFCFSNLLHQDYLASEYCKNEFLSIKPND